MLTRWSGYSVNEAWVYELCVIWVLSGCWLDEQIGGQQLFQLHLLSNVHCQMFVIIYLLSYMHCQMFTAEKWKIIIISSDYMTRKTVAWSSGSGWGFASPS